MKAFFVGLLALGLQVCTTVVAEEPQVKPIFADKFNSALAKEWSWINEDPTAWRIDKDGLQIRALPGHGIQRKNRLLGPTFKAGAELAAEVFVEFHPSTGFEHAGLQCFFDDRNWLGLINEADIVMACRKNDASSWQTLRHREDLVWLRMVISGGKAAGFYRVKAEDEWKKFAEFDLPSQGDFRIGLAAGGGPKEKEDWAHFRDFRILPLPK